MAMETLIHKIIRVAGNIKRNIVFLMANDLADRFYYAKDEAIEDCVYEFEENKKLFKKLNILDRSATLALLKDKPKSFVRFGDGEIDIMQGKDSQFQLYDPVLSSKMKTILAEPHDNLYVGINPSYFQSAFRFPERQHRFYREKGTKYRDFFLRHCNSSTTYLDACCFGAYFRFSDEYNFEAYYTTVRSFFKDRNIILVSGTGVFEKLTFDVFDLAKSKTIVHGPNINAFSEYEKILKNVINIADKENSFICVILGQTAKVLVAELASRGYLAWDVGHLAKDYDVYMRGVAKTKENMDEFWGID